MRQIAGLGFVRLPIIYQERFQRFDEKEEQIYDALKTPKLQTLHGRKAQSCISPLTQEKILTIIQKGVVVARLYSWQDSGPGSTTQDMHDEENLAFRGSCFLISEGIFVCCSHQIEANKKYIIRTTDLSENTGDGNIIVKEVCNNPLGKRIIREAIAWEYAFLAVETNETTKEMFKKSLENIQLAFIEEKPSQIFRFTATIYGYLEKLPIKFKHSKAWQGWKISQLVSSSGSAYYKDKEFSYTNCIQHSFEGAPITISSRGSLYIVGIHSRGLNFLGNNEGFLFGKQFFSQLSKFKKKLQHKTVNYENLKIIANSQLSPLSNLVQSIELLKDLLTQMNQIKNQDKQIAFVGDLLYKIIRKMVKFEESQLAIEKLSVENVLISKQGDKLTKLDFTRLELSDNTEKTNQLANFNCLVDLCEEIQRLSGLSSFIHNYTLKQKAPLLLIILKALQLATTKPLSQRNLSRILAYLQAQIVYVQYGQEKFHNVQSFFLSCYYADFNKQFYQKEQKQREFEQIISLENFKLDIVDLRQKFMLLFKYSFEKFTKFTITKIYLRKLSILQHQFKIAAGLCSRLLSQDMSEGKSNRYEYQLNLLIFLSDFAQFKAKVPAFTFFFWQLQKQAEKMDIQYNSQYIKERYQTLLSKNNLVIKDQILTSLVENEILFYYCYYKNYLRVINELQQKQFYAKYLQLFKEAYQNKYRGQLDKLIFSYDNAPLKPRLSSNQMTFNVLQATILQQVFKSDECNQEQSSDKIAQRELKDRKFNQLVDLFVEVQDAKGFLQGEGFVLNKELSFYNFLKLMKEDPIIQWVKKMFVTLDHFLLKVLGKIIILNSMNIYLKRLTLNDLVFSPNSSTDVLFQSPPISVLLPNPISSSEQYNEQKRSCQQANKCAFCEFITEISSKEFLACSQSNNSLIEQSILVRQMSLINSQRSLQDYYLHHLEGKYYFDKTSYSLRPNQLLLLESLPKRHFEQASESKLQLLFKQLPFQYVLRLNSVRSTFRNIDKEIQQKLYAPRRDFLREWNNDVSRLIALSQVKIDQNNPYFLANQLIQEGIISICASLENKQGENALLTTSFAEKEGIQTEKDQFLADFHRYLRHLTSFSSMSSTQKNAFISRQLSSYQEDRRKAEMWDLIANIIELHEFFN